MAIYKNNVLKQMTIVKCFKLSNVNDKTFVIMEEIINNHVTKHIGSLEVIDNQYVINTAIDSDMISFNKFVSGLTSEKFNEIAGLGYINIDTSYLNSVDINCINSKLLTLDDEVYNKVIAFTGNISISSKKESSKFHFFRFIFSIIMCLIICFLSMYLIYRDITSKIKESYRDSVNVRNLIEKCNSGVEKIDKVLKNDLGKVFFNSVDSYLVLLEDGKLYNSFSSKCKLLNDDNDIIIKDIIVKDNNYYALDSNNNIYSIEGITLGDDVKYSLGYDYYLDNIKLLKSDDINIFNNNQNVNVIDIFYDEGNYYIDTNNNVYNSDFKQIINGNIFDSSIKNIGFNSNYIVFKSDYSFYIYNKNTNNVSKSTDFAFDIYSNIIYMDDNIFYKNNGVASYNSKDYEELFSETLFSSLDISINKDNIKSIIYCCIGIIVLASISFIFRNRIIIKSLISYYIFLAFVFVILYIFTKLKYYLFIINYFNIDPPIYKVFLTTFIVFIIYYSIKNINKKIADKVKLDSYIVYLILYFFTFIAVNSVLFTIAYYFLIST